MDPDSSEVALLSIRPHYAEAILSGEKRVEFRKTPFARKVRYAVIYATKPVGKVLGWFKVDGVEAMSPTELWWRFKRCGGICESDFNDYYADADLGYAIRVGETVRFRQAKSLCEVCDSGQAPQSFRYLPKSAGLSLIAASC
jgi:predicted transcriptional regulator